MLPPHRSLRVGETRKRLSVFDQATVIWLELLGRLERLISSHRLIGPHDQLEHFIIATRWQDLLSHLGRFYHTLNYRETFEKIVSNVLSTRLVGVSITCSHAL